MKNGYSLLRFANSVIKSLVLLKMNSNGALMSMGDFFKYSILIKMYNSNYFYRILHYYKLWTQQKFLNIF